MSSIFTSALRKILTTGALSIAIGVVAFQARQIWALRRQLQTLEQLQTPLENQVQQLTHNLEHASSALARIRAENDALKRANKELFKLRAEVAVLRVQSATNGAKNLSAVPGGQSQLSEEDGLTDEQKVALELWRKRLNTGNSGDDLERLRDSLKRWDELFIKPAPPEMKPVFVILKKNLRDRITELENQ